MNKEKVFKKYKEKAEGLLSDNHRVSNLISSATEKLKGIMSSNEQLKDFSYKVMVVLRMLKAQVTGEYREIPWRTLLLSAGAMLYFITPLDVIPDFIPALGLTDDIAILFWVYNSVKEDIERFEMWENTLELEVEDES
ncbi:YkvA family protein [Reichenbachiella agarivorans]|uniref:YkvA family protein n=1 Tax=Reichenbachiella agarivorans TaxID=2979464 RepID=A0ABY6CKQ5_9BACT|nr:YkvA family protein [Reichenbachiella agarivorans]UXP30670.1 YkvA family protein [Reichenbachiella agarivorans]